MKRKETDKENTRPSQAKPVHARSRSMGDTASASASHSAAENQQQQGQEHDQPNTHKKRRSMRTPAAAKLPRRVYTPLSARPTPSRRLTLELPSPIGEDEDNHVSHWEKERNELQEVIAHLEVSWWNHSRLH